MSTYVYFCDNCQKVFSGEKQNGTAKVCSVCQKKLKATDYTLEEWNGFSADEKENLKVAWHEECEKRREARRDRLPVTTADLKIDYTIVGSVYGEAFGPEPRLSYEKLYEECLEQVRKKAFDLEADAVVGMRMNFSDGIMQMYGTAVKKKAEKK